MPFAETTEPLNSIASMKGRVSINGTSLFYEYFVQKDKPQSYRAIIDVLPPGSKAKNKQGNLIGMDLIVNNIPIHAENFVLSGRNLFCVYERGIKDVTNNIFTFLKNYSMILQTPETAYEKVLGIIKLSRVQLSKIININNINKTINNIEIELKNTQDLRYRNKLIELKLFLDLVACKYNNLQSSLLPPGDLPLENGFYLSDAYSTPKMKEWLITAFQIILDGYKQIVEEYFPTIKQLLPLYSLLPVELKCIIYQSNMGWGKAQYLIPIEKGEKNIITINAKSKDKFKKEWHVNCQNIDIIKSNLRKIGRNPYIASQAMQFSINLMIDQSTGILHKSILHLIERDLKILFGKNAGSFTGEMGALL